jgi:hypothetical protein
MSRIPKAVAGLALIAATAVACGSDDGDDTTAADTAAPSAGATTPSTAETPTESSSPVSSDAPSTDPVPSPIIDKAVKGAIKDDFPALVPSGVPDGWTVLSATYAGKRGGIWQIALTDPNGAPVTLMQSTASAADLVAQLLPDGQASGTVRISGTGKWKVYQGSGSSALAKDLAGTGAVVVGPDAETVATLADQLLTAEDGGNPDGG